MPEAPQIPQDVLDFGAALREDIGAMFGRQMQPIMEHVVKAVTKAGNARDIASDRWNPLTVVVPAGEPREVVSASSSRARIMILNTSSVTVAIGNDRNMTLTGPERFDLPAGTGVVLETRGAVWAMAASDASLGLIIEQWNQAGDLGA